MTAFADFTATRRWPAQHPDRLQLYSVPTPNGVKVSIMLEAIGLPYEAHYIRFDANEQKSGEFTQLNVNGRIPAILDPHGPGGQPLALGESGAILIYLADKSGRFLPTNPVQRYQTLQWLMFQMSGVGPMFGQLGFFHKFAGSAWEDKRPLERYVGETRRLLGVLDAHLARSAWLAGDEFTIADIATFPWVGNLVGFYAAGDLVGFNQFTHVRRALAAFSDLPAVNRGSTVPQPPQDPEAA